ncbi:MAG TPA: protein kinase, partial [Polyangia bacterium]|nr:protein kinase [Polyangia bacterium]
MVVAFLAGGLAAPDRSVVESHIEACRDCAELMTWAASDQANRSRSIGREGRAFIGQLAPGSRVDRYQILGAVGRGGMGEVYAAYHPDLDRRIALKVVHEAGGDSAVRRARLLREARAIARLSHPNVVSVYDAGTVDDRVYIAMEFVDGKTIHEWLRSGPRSWREILDVFLGAARGLAAAHAAGVIHRDFKPQNVMIGRDRSVRVMDFGLARLAEEPSEPEDGSDAVERSPVPVTVTKTGALIGTVAYMAPEQFRGEPLDARADQFSFCVAFHEALFGTRPQLSHVTATPEADNPNPPRAFVPGWLHASVSRGLAENRDERFASMDDLMRALNHGRARPRRRAIGASIGLAALLVAVGGWRAARGARINCAVPADRLAAVWSGHDDARRQSVHRAFISSGRPNAETSWQRVSGALDDYIHDWSAMHVQACDATYVRREQSGEALDLRMSCLNENLDQVRALTDVLATGDSSNTAQATFVVQDLPQISRCADLSALRSAIPPPRNEHTARAARDLASVINDVNALYDLGNYRSAHAKAVSIRKQAEALEYKPLLGQLLEATGRVESELEPARAEPVLEEAVFTAQACRDDSTAAKAASTLAYLEGARLGKSQAEADRWARLAIATLDRMGRDQPRIRAWVLHDQAIGLLTQGYPERAYPLLEQSLGLKESVLGKDHPDVARTLTALASTLHGLGKDGQALPIADRSVAIVARIDADSALLATVTNNRGEIHTALGR